MAQKHAASPASLQVAVLTQGIGEGPEKDSDAEVENFGSGLETRQPIRWEAKVYWNRYTQLASDVLTKFISRPGLIITVRFEMPAEGATDEKVRQVRAVLWERRLPGNPN